MSRHPTGTLSWPRVECSIAGRASSSCARRCLPAELDSGPVTEVLARYPRTGVADELFKLTAAQAELRPESRIGLLARLGFQGLVRANPLDR